MVDVLKTEFCKEFRNDSYTRTVDWSIDNLDVFMTLTCLRGKHEG